jgi:hypothetical protein
VNEAELEARLAALLKGTLPWLERRAIRLQWRFQLRLGHNKYDVDGRVDFNATGRADVVIFDSDRPIALIELKAPGVALTDEDRKQGVSYGRLLDPIAPLVILSNGSDTKLYSTWTGKSLQRSTLTQGQFEKMIKSVATLAARDVEEAIATLIGPDSAIAVGLINKLSQIAINEMTGAWEDNLRPFAEGLIFSRKAAAQIDFHLSRSSDIVLLSGPPLIGKSNVLRELLAYSHRRRSVAFLFLEAGSSQHGLFQILAHAFAVHLGWPATANDARQWLRQVSHGDSITLIVAIDDVDPDRMGPELDELASEAFGPRLRLVLSCSQRTVARLTRSATGRQASRIGRRARILELGTLDDEEFVVAARTLDNVRITFVRGAQHAQEYRSPWVLRSIVSHIHAQANYADDSLAAAVPSLPGHFLMHLAETRFREDEELRGRYAEFCKALLQDVDEAYEPLAVALVASFTCHRATLLKYLSETELNEALERGEFKSVLLEHDERAVVAQLPELAALLLSNQLGQHLAAMRGQSSLARAELLARVCSRVFFGDVIGARALHEAARATRGIPSGIIATLLSWSPKEVQIQPGARLALPMGEGVFAEIEVQSDGSMVVKLPDGTTERVEAEPELPVGYDRMIPWLILTYFAATPIAAVDKRGKTVGWVDVGILLPIGRSPIVLHAVRGWEPRALAIHNLPGVGSFVCHNEGIVEPITFAMTQLMSFDTSRGDYLVAEALRERSIPLMFRLYTALQMISGFAGEERRTWAQDLLKRLKPFLSSKLLHGDTSEARRSKPPGSQRRTTSRKR